MAPKQAAQVAGQKRGPGRPPKNREPPAKKTRTSPTPQSRPSTVTLSPPVESPPPVKRAPKLPTTLAENRPLPALTEAQAPGLSDQEYQSIAASAVLQTSLDLSRNRWIGDGILQRYWVKPETGKHARPPPPGNPEVKWQKHQGPCRVRIEPHILEVDLYVEQKPKQVSSVKQYVPPAPPRPLPPYNPPQPPQQSPFGIQRNPQLMQPPPPPQHQQPSNTSFPTVNPQRPAPGPPQPPPPQAPQVSTPQEKKITTDPVISLLASRASSDPVLKALMKEVANGDATQEQLKIFQSHIDELTKIIADKKKKEEEEVARKAARVSQQPQGIRYDAHPDNRSIQPPKPYQVPQPPAPPVYQPPPRQYQPPPPPPPPPPQPVILAFTGPGSSEDRFLFPQYSILESLSPQHLLVSFITTRKGRESADPTGLEPELEYWQPITLMVEVAYKREHFLDFIKRWVKPADEVCKHMEETMKRCTRAPVTSLALRLPFRGSAMAESEDAPPEIALPLPTPPAEEKPKVKYARKNAAKRATGDAAALTAGTGPQSFPQKIEASGTEDTKQVSSTGDSTTVGVATADAPAPAVAPVAGTTVAPEVSKDVEQKESTSGSVAENKKVEEPAVKEDSRPKRAVRKSVRISEGT